MNKCTQQDIDIIEAAAKVYFKEKIKYDLLAHMSQLWRITTGLNKPVEQSAEPKIEYFDFVSIHESAREEAMLCLPCTLLDSFHLIYCMIKQKEDWEKIQEKLNIFNNDLIKLIRDELGLNG